MQELVVVMAVAASAALGLLGWRAVVRVDRLARESRRADDPPLSHRGR